MSYQKQPHETFVPKIELRGDDEFGGIWIAYYGRVIGEGSSPFEAVMDFNNHFFSGHPASKYKQWFDD